MGVLRAGEMPPGGAAQPGPRERAALIAGIDRWLRANRPDERRQTYPAARRLTRGEYTHTLREFADGTAALSLS